MLIKLYNEEYLIYVEQTYFPQWHDRKYIYIISSWSVSRLISRFQSATSSAYVVLKEYCTCISMEYLIAVLKNKERTSTFKKWRSMWLIPYYG